MYLVKLELSKKKMIALNSFHETNQLVDRIAHPSWYWALSWCRTACHPLSDPFPGEWMEPVGENGISSKLALCIFQTLGFLALSFLKSHGFWKRFLFLSHNPRKKKCDYELINLSSGNDLTVIISKENSSPMLEEGSSGISTTLQINKAWLGTWLNLVTYQTVLWLT